MIGTRIHITGIVQGVGFRPFVYGQAIKHGLTGWVCNTSAGVDIEVNGQPGKISYFIDSLRTEAPPLARIDSLEFQEIPVTIKDDFSIVESVQVSDAFQPISPDICICTDCLEELLDPKNRRYRYPFINCTNCGPRLTIIEEIPYDRPNTTMKDFTLCPDCHEEYIDPTNRRFHAQPVACPVCGPQVWLEGPSKNGKSAENILAKGDDAIQSARKILKHGGIIAIKGLGGFHIACDATNSKAVEELRRRKLRVDKPFALMMPDISAVLDHCSVSDSDHQLLISRERPIVILGRKKTSKIAPEVAPNQNTIGVMLPYTPLHYLLFAPRTHKNENSTAKRWDMPPLVMTSGNISEEPIAISNEEARDRLSGLADAFLMHDRTIRTRCDDSVVRSLREVAFPVRRSRGYAPFPVYLQSKSPQVIAVGAELKNTFCITRDRYAFLSHHIGDMENVETFDAFTDSIAHYESLFKVKPEAIAYDNHPNYLATRYALQRAAQEGLPSYSVQHHYAHIVSCMTENSIVAGRPVIGIAFDGTGYGDDGAIWGGEFLITNGNGYQRICHLKYVPLPGGDTAIRKPSRTALAYLWANNLEWDLELSPVAALCAEERTILRAQLDKKINSPLTSSMGRFFDAVASLAGVRQVINYEAQAAIEFEAAVDHSVTSEYELALEPLNSTSTREYQINPNKLLCSLIEDVQENIPVPTIAARFHNAVARMVSITCTKLRDDYGINDVALSGGVWQNLTLLTRTLDLLNSDHFNVFIHQKVPTNDGGLALGQAVVAINRMKHARL